MSVLKRGEAREVSAEGSPGDLTSLQAYLSATFCGPIGREGRRQDSPPRPVLAATGDHAAPGSAAEPDGQVSKDGREGCHHLMGSLPGLVFNHGRQVEALTLNVT